MFDERIYARKCESRELTKCEFKEFCNAHHIQGSKQITSFRCGLFYGKALVSVMSLGLHPRNNTQIVLDRFCTKAGFQILGGASKLLAKCKEWASSKEYTAIITWSDNRWGAGKVYPAMGFELDAELPPDYSYIDLKNTSYMKRISKHSHQKSMIGRPQGVSERKWALQHGFSRIWDCGKKRWKFNL